MITIDEILRRIKPYVLGWIAEYNSGVSARIYNHNFVGLQAPLTSTSWDGDAYSTTAKTLIDLSSVFGAPGGITAVLFYVSVKDSASASSDTYLVLSPNNTAGKGMIVSPLTINDRDGRYSVVVPCDANGDIYYQVAASGAGTFDVVLEIWGYWV